MRNCRLFGVYARLCNLVVFADSAEKDFCIVHFAIALVGILAFRFVFRRAFLDLTEAGRAEGGERTLIVGAGNAGRMIVREIHNAKEQGDVNNPSKASFRYALSMMI